MDQEPTAAEEELVRRFAEAFFPSAAGPTLRLSTCIITESPDGDFVLGALPDAPEIVVGAGFTGHGYKFASVVGDALADFAVDGDTDLPVDPHGIGRFT